MLEFAFMLSITFGALLTVVTVMLLGGLVAAKVSNAVERRYGDAAGIVVFAIIVVLVAAFLITSASMVGGVPQ